jgi:basic membrane lipoprotein Med (substrate-binding protein (PBP1-ABC) superfamily)
VHAYQAESQEGGFVLGVIAALMSESGVLGIAGPVEAGDAKLFVDGFAEGAKYARPDIKVNISYTGSFSDVSLMAAAANTHISAGADMLTGLPSPLSVRSVLQKIAARIGLAPSGTNPQSLLKPW